MNIYLTGFMGSGKSSTGRKIASSLLWNFADTDKIVEEQEGATVPDLFKQKGEDYFRRAEARALRTVSERSRTVVACGGGTPCSADNLEVMRSTGVIVYLKLPVVELAKRLQKSATVRPLLQGTGKDEMTSRVRELLESRTGWYEKADLIIEGPSTTVEEITSLIADLVRSRGAYL
ncbi:shikimate kinase [bacterium]|nr:shikimate kinase [bacterium]